MPDLGTPMPHRASSPHRGVLVTLGVAVALLAAALVFVALQLSSDATVADRRASALAAARQGVVNFTSLDYRNLDQEFRLIEASGTGSFLEDLRSHEAALRKTYVADQIVSRGTVLDAAVTASSSREATVVLFVDATLKGKTVSTPVQTRYRASVHMVRSGNRWLVEEVTPVA